MTDLETALRLFYDGDEAGLDRYVRERPRVIHARMESAGGHYAGYFHRATLLHHVAGNPIIEPLPVAAPAMARLMIDHGAAVDAATAAGPLQPDDIGWSALGLVATSLEARRAGHQRSLMEILLDRGADVDFRNGGPLVGALYYGEAEAAAFLVERGARVDLRTAAGLGRPDLMDRFVHPDGSLADDAHGLVHYSQVKDPPASRDEVLGVALVFAVRAGQREAVAWLLARGADARARPPFDHRATALHWAAFHGHEEIASLLLDRGADKAVRDSSFGATPQGWAEHATHQGLAARLAPPS